MRKQFKAQFFAFTAMLLFSSAGWAQVPNYVPSNGLVGWWPFNGNANDLSGNGNNGTVNGATLTTDRNGVANSAYYFSSSGCATRIDVNVNTSSIQTGLTMSVWVMNVGNGCLGPRLLEFWGNNGPGQAQWGTSYSQGLYGIGSITSTGFSCSAGIPMSPNNIWSHLVYTNNGSQGKFYKDGVLITTINSTGNPILASSAAFGRMNHPAYDAYNGNLDDIGIWNRALSECEVAALYSGQPLTPPIVNIGSDTLSICGLNTTLDATNSAAVSYLWNTGDTTSSVTIFNSGEYTVTVTDSIGCAASDTVYVSIIDPTITAGSSAFCLGDSTVLMIQSTGNTCGGVQGSLQNGLVGWWPFCGNANDESGNGNNGTVNGATLSTDRFGNSNQAYSFDGVNDYIDVLDNPELRLSSTDFTISFWANVDSFNNLATSYICKRGNGNTNGWFINSNNGNHNIELVTSSGVNPLVESNYFMSTLNWTNIIIIYSTINNKVDYYINGLLDISIPNSGLIFNGSCNSIMRFGYDTYSPPNAYWLNGKLDDIGIWNRTITQQEIQSLYNQGNLSTWWSDGTTNQNSIQVQPTQTTTYSVTVSDGVGSCTDSITIQVNNPQINAGSDLSVCEGDSVTLTATGATTYGWDNGIVNGQAFLPTIEGYYTVVGTDTLGCSNTASVFLDLLQPTASTIERVACDTYLAPDDAIYSSSGTYTAIIPNAAGCDSTITLVLTVNNSSTSTQTATGVDSFTWPVNGQTYTQSGVYTAVVTNVDGCDSTITLNLSLEFSGISDIANTGFIITPNPFANSFTLQVNEKYIGEEFVILNQLGSIVKNGNINSSKMEIDMIHFSQGIYLFKLKSSNQEHIRLIKY